MFKSQKELLDEIFDELNVKVECRENLSKIIQLVSKDETDRDKLYEVIQTNYSLMN